MMPLNALELDSNTKLELTTLALRVAHCTMCFRPREDAQRWLFIMDCKSCSDKDLVLKIHEDEFGVLLRVFAQAQKTRTGNQKSASFVLTMHWSSEPRAWKKLEPDPFLYFTVVCQWILMPGPPSPLSKSPYLSSLFCAPVFSALLARVAAKCTNYICATDTPGFTGMLWKEHMTVSLSSEFSAACVGTNFCQASPEKRPKRHFWHPMRCCPQAHYCCRAVVVSCGPSHNSLNSGENGT